MFPVQVSADDDVFLLFVQPETPRFAKNEAFRHMEGVNAGEKTGTGEGGVTEGGRASVGRCVHICSLCRCRSRALPLSVLLCSVICPKFMFVCLENNKGLSQVPRLTDPAAVREWKSSHNLYGQFCIEYHDYDGIIAPGQAGCTPRTSAAFEEASKAISSAIAR